MVLTQPDGYPQGAREGGPGPSAEGTTRLGASLEMSLLAAAEVAQKRIFPNCLCFRNKEGREMRRQSIKKKKTT